MVIRRAWPHSLALTVLCRNNSGLRGGAIFVGAASFPDQPQNEALIARTMFIANNATDGGMNQIFVDYLSMSMCLNFYVQGPYIWTIALPSKEN